MKLFTLILMFGFLLWPASKQTFFNPSRSFENDVHPLPFQSDLFEIIECFSFGMLRGVLINLFLL